jgi:hypothetical protein
VTGTILPFNLVTKSFLFLQRQEKVSFLEVKIFVVVFRQKKMAFKEVAILTRFPQKLCCVFCVCEKATKVSL